MIRLDITPFAWHEKTPVPGAGLVLDAREVFDAQEAQALEHLGGAEVHDRVMDSAAVARWVDPAVSQALALGDVSLRWPGREAVPVHVGAPTRRTAEVLARHLAFQAECHGVQARLRGGARVEDDPGLREHLVDLVRAAAGAWSDYTAAEARAREAWEAAIRASADDEAFTAAVAQVETTHTAWMEAARAWDSEHGRHLAAAPVTADPQGPLTWAEVADAVGVDIGGWRVGFAWDYHAAGGAGPLAHSVDRACHIRRGHLRDESRPPAPPAHT